MDRFSGASALVSGGSSGIGKAVAKRFASEGARVTIVGAPADNADVDATVDEFRGDGYAVAGGAIDVSSPAGAEAAVAMAVEHGGGRLDVSVVTAGYIDYPDPFLDAELESFQRTFEVNVQATFLLGQQAGRIMRDAGGGSIINTSSTNAFMVDEATASYCAAKAAVSALTRGMAIDLAPYGIRVNAVVPGMVQTRGTAPMIENREFWDVYKVQIPMDRPGTVDELAGVYAFLASDDASYMTGSLVVCDGAFSAGIRWRGWLELPADQ